ncbi:unannotated protein [freshwater metagenome]|uniref:Unannotated protein n=1 Tax=freshwater metagenome TaxID=449393 RepID=A0A6J7J0J0_9ZZZZ
MPPNYFRCCFLWMCLSTLLLIKRQRTIHSHIFQLGLMFIARHRWQKMIPPISLSVHKHQWQSMSKPWLGLWTKVLKYLIMVIRFAMKPAKVDLRALLPSLALFRHTFDRYFAKAKARFVGWLYLEIQKIFTAPIKLSLICFQKMKVCIVG